MQPPFFYVDPITIEMSCTYKDIVEYHTPIWLRIGIHLPSIFTAFALDFV